MSPHTLLALLVAHFTAHQVREQPLNALRAEIEALRVVINAHKLSIPDTRPFQAFLDLANGDTEGNTRDRLADALVDAGQGLAQLHLAPEGPPQ